MTKNKQKINTLKCKNIYSRIYVQLNCIELQLFAHCCGLSGRKHFIVGHFPINVLLGHVVLIEHVGFFFYRLGVENKDFL